MTIPCRQTPTPCNEIVVAAPRSASAPFTVCVGTNALTWDGQDLHLTKGTAIPDGEYTSFTMTNGCITSVGHAPVPEYTPPPCVESPAPCGGTGGGAVVSPRAGNLTIETPTGIFTQVALQPGSGVDITGSGTVGDPYVIAAETSSGGSIIAGTSDIVVAEPALGVTSIGLKASGIAPGTYAGITFNSRGIATGYAAPSAGAITSVVGALEVDSETQSGVVTISLKPSQAGGDSYVVGGYTMEVSQGGTISAMTKDISITAGVYALGAHNVTLNDTGSVTSIERAVTLTAGSFATMDGKTVSYDEFGTITGIA